LYNPQTKQVSSEQKSSSPQSKKFRVNWGKGNVMLEGVFFLAAKALSIISSSLMVKL